MSALHRHRHALGSLTAIVILGAGSATCSASDASWEVTPSAAEPADSRRVETAEELERLIPDGAFNAQPSTQLMVGDNPVLTDRGFVHIPASDFTPTTEQTGGASGVFMCEDGFVYGGSSSFFTEAVAAVFLPEGVTVNLVAVTAVDDSFHYLTLSLRRHYRLSPSTDLMAYMETDTDNPGVAIWLDDTINQPVIDNDNYQYYLFAENLTTEKKLRSVFIYYEY